MDEDDLSSFDLIELPAAENDEFEYKSSAAPLSEVRKKMACAGSAFANSGGGHFVVGVDDKGNADGGVPPRIGRQSLRDWTDQALHNVEPPPKYDIKLVNDSSGRGTIKRGNVVLVVRVRQSHVGPHMAPDNKYYIRAGAHTVPARHFIVEAIWAKRHLSKPRLTHRVRQQPENEDVIQLGLVALTDSPAIDDQLTVTALGEEVPRYLKTYDAPGYSMRIPVIDRSHPFFFDVALWSDIDRKTVPDIQLSATYEDLAGMVAVHGGRANREGGIWFLKWARIESQRNSKAERPC